MNQSETFKNYLLGMGLTAIQVGIVMHRRTARGDAAAVGLARRIVALNQAASKIHGNGDVQP